MFWTEGWLGPGELTLVPGLTLGIEIAATNRFHIGFSFFWGGEACVGYVRSASEADKRTAKLL
jgi:hypothetical protein